MSLLLTWNRFYTLLWCLRCTLWTNKGWLGSDVVVRKSNVNSLWDFGNQRFSVVFKSSRNELILLDSLKFPVDFRVDSLSNLEYFLVKLQPTVIQLYEKGICLSCFIWDWDFYQNITLASTNKLETEHCISSLLNRWKDSFRTFSEVKGSNPRVCNLAMRFSRHLRKYGGLYLISDLVLKIMYSKAVLFIF